MTRKSPTLNAMRGPTMCLAWAYWPPAEATVEVTSESIMATLVYSRPATQQATRPAIMPPLPTEKFQPIYSPTSTMPTPSAQMWTGPSTLSRLRRLSAAAAPVAVDMINPSDFVAFLGQLDLAFARG